MSKKKFFLLLLCGAALERCDNQYGYEIGQKLGEKTRALFVEESKPTLEILEYPGKHANAPYKLIYSGKEICEEAKNTNPMDDKYLKELIHETLEKCRVEGF